MPGIFIEVWRLEHLSCPKEAGHGPMKRCNSFNVPEFGTIGCGPRHIQSWHSCGVTPQQFHYWWITWDERHNKVAEADNWNFISYLVPIEECMVDRGQIVFAARSEYFNRIIAWDELPTPQYSGYGDWSNNSTAHKWHKRRYDEYESGQALTDLHIVVSV